jgi:hypothetical protein
VADRRQISSSGRPTLCARVAAVPIIPGSKLTTPPAVSHDMDSTPSVGLPLRRGVPETDASASLSAAKRHLAMQD